MRLSVVTVCLNSQDTIRATIESFLAQTHSDKELLIIDGVSSDATLDIVRSFRAAEIRIVSEKDAGVFDAMNKGLRQFGGDAVSFLNADDTFHDPQVLAAVDEALKDADVAYGDLLMVTDHETKTVVREWRAGPYGKFAFQLGWQPPHPGFFARRGVVERVGLFDLGYKTAADYDWMLRVLSLPDVRPAYLSRVLADFKMGGVSTRDWKATLRGTQETLRSRRQHLGSPPIDAAVFLRLFRRLFQVRNFRRYYGN